MSARRALLPLLVPLALACHEVHLESVVKPGEIAIYDDLFSVSVQDRNHVVAAGYWGAIYLTSDGGETWTKAETGTTKLIYDVSMANELRGWAVGQLGLVLRTEDGGSTWTQQPNAKEQQNVHLFAVQALDERRAWAVGEWGTRIYTADGGRTWQDHSLTIDATNPQFVWLSTADQDRVRAGEKVFEDVGLNDVSCLPQDTSRCWMIGEFGYVFRTTSGGMLEDRPDWERGEIVGGIQVPYLELGYDLLELGPEQVEQVRNLADEIEDQQHLNIAIEPKVSAQEIEAFGSATDPSALFDIVDARTQAVQTVVEEAGILSDRIRRRGASPWDYQDFLEDDPEFLKRWIEGRRAEKPGVAVEIAQNPYLFTIRFADAERGLISGLGGVVLQSQDGGRSWHYEEIGRKQAAFAVAPLDAGRVILVGEKGLVRVSDDFGQSWHAPEHGFPNVFTFMRDVSFTLDRRVGYIVGQNGLVLRSSDGGGTWKKLLPPEGRSAQSLTRREDERWRRLSLARARADLDG